MKAIISNGGFKFHLAPAAAELSRHGALAMFITAGYPTAAFERAAARFGLGRSGPWQRLLDRAEALPAESVRPLWLPELMLQAGRGLRIAGFAALAEVAALRRYALAAQRLVGSSDAHVYHYRSGYGGMSVAAARRRGMLCLCDHSIADPRLLAHFVSHDGRWPASPDELLPHDAMPAFWRRVLDDMLQADHVIVNSAFVKRGMTFMGFDPARVHVIPLGVDAKFLQHVRPRGAGSAHAVYRPMRLMYAGGLLPRKGFGLLVEALRGLDDMHWTLEIAGGADRATLQAHRAFLDDRRVRYLGTLSRARLAERLASADVFVFPSLAEGSARVVFEAMAAGCYVITTENSGSIVEDGVHGRLVEQGSVDDIAAKIRDACVAPLTVAAIGRANQHLVLSRYRQADYGAALLALYTRLRRRA